MASVCKLDATTNTGKHTKQSYIQCMQINLQHSKVATANLMQITEALTYSASRNLTQNRTK